MLAVMIIALGLEGGAYAEIARLGARRVDVTVANRLAALVETLFTKLTTTGPSAIA
jgi:hypothetical protein